MAKHGWRVLDMGRDEPRQCRVTREGIKEGWSGVQSSRLHSEQGRQQVLNDESEGSTRVKQEAIDLIKGFEGFRSEAYWDVTRYSIGYGTVGTKGQTITREQAEKALRKEVNRLYRVIVRRCELCDSNHVIALISFSYNVGLGNLLQSSLFKYAQKGEHKKASEEFKKWVYAADKVMVGLVNRRNKERKVYDGEGN